MSGNPIMTFPIKKRINTELFIGGKQKLYTQKGHSRMLGGPMGER